MRIEGYVCMFLLEVLRWSVFCKRTLVLHNIKILIEILYVGRRGWSRYVVVVHNYLSLPILGQFDVG
jgi:hypothetical protein